MLEIAVMIEGQNGLTWPRWQRIAHLVEEAGFVGLFRSDHFTNSNTSIRESLELWTSLTWLASHTSRIEFGPLVTPFSFRHPVHTARMASAVDDLSEGRLVLGLGAGWNESEHEQFGFDLLDTDARFERYREGMEVVTRLLQSDTPVTFEGRYYQLRGAHPPAAAAAPRRPTDLDRREWNETNLALCRTLRQRVELCFADTRKVRPLEPAPRSNAS
jgi:alkanesulfonate monooxygenase SsuD/methylene tetrahydromethanopterin reductase-like flavin-dependent oxidoreductase (luciferase family)